MELILVDLPLRFDAIEEHLHDRVTTKKTDELLRACDLVHILLIDYPYEVLGIETGLHAAQGDKYAWLAEFKGIVPEHTKNRLRNMMVLFRDRLATTLTNIHTELKAEQKRNNAYFLQKGHIEFTPHNPYVLIKKQQDTLLAMLQSLESNLQLQNSTELPIHDHNTIHFTSISSQHRPAKEEKALGFFEDEMQNDFYMNLPDLKESVPNVYLQNIKFNQSQHVSDFFDSFCLDQIQSLVLDDDGEQKGLYSALFKKYDDFHEGLQQCKTQEAADQLAKEYFLVVTKASRNKFLYDLLEYRRDYAQAVPFYCRLVATLSRHQPDLAKHLLAKALDEYHHLQEKSMEPALVLEKRTRYLLYVLELTKFGLSPPSKVLSVLQSLVSDFSGGNIELVLFIFEEIGYFMMNCEDSKIKMGALAKQVSSLAKQKSLSTGLVSRIENTLMAVNFREKKALRQKRQKALLEEYIDYLVLHRLRSEEDVTIVAQEMLKLPWKSEPVESVLVRYLLKAVRKRQFYQMNYVAAMVAFLGQHYPACIARLVDLLAEDLLCSLETNNFEQRQQRVQVAKFYTELFNYQVLDYDQLFAALYLVLEYGHGPTVPKARQDQLDPPDDTFRVSLSGTMLETAAPFLKSKKLRVRLGKYLLNLQRYVLTKSYLPMLLEFMLLDILESLAPKITRFKNLSEVEAILLELHKDEKQNQGRAALEILYKKPPAALPPKEATIVKEPQDFQDQLNSIMGDQKPGKKGMGLGQMLLKKPLLQKKK